METLIEAHYITGGYGSTMVLRELSLGPNGAGKTTAIRMLPSSIIVSPLAFATITVLAGWQLSRREVVL